MTHIVNSDRQIIDLFCEIDPKKKINVHFNADRPIKYKFVSEIDADVFSIDKVHTRIVTSNERFLVVTVDDSDGPLLMTLEKYILEPECFSTDAIIIPAVVGGVVVLIFICLIAYLLYRKHKYGKYWLFKNK